MAHLFDFGFNNIELWRSEEMQLVQLMIPSEAAHETVRALGNVGLLQFKDLNVEKSAFQRTFASQVKRCDELSRKLRYLEEQVQKAGIVMASSTVPRHPIIFDELETLLERLEKEVIDLTENNGRLARSYNELLEMQILLELGGRFFNDARQDISLEGTSRSDGGTDGVVAPLLEAAQPYELKMSKLGSLAGLIATSKASSFERMLFRATRGNMFLSKADAGRMSDPLSGESMEKTVFIVFFSGERVRTKITKICEAFGANRYPFPDDISRQRQMYAEVSGRLGELKMTLDMGDSHRLNVLQDVANSVSSWSTLVQSEKVIYHTLNKLSLDVTHRVMVGEAWLPTKARSQVTDVLRHAAEGSSTKVTTVLQRLSTFEAPPTYFQTSKFTEVFQSIVDAYGVARYHEVNPSVFTIMTFPFLFAVMFGDLGHGFLMTLFAVMLLALEQRLSRQSLDDMSAMLFAGRYCIFLMALFSMFVGLIYNEAFSIPMTFWGPTRWKCYVNDAESGISDMRDCAPAGGELHWPGGSPYPFGVDPIWRGTKTELPFLNSYKMKMSILLGVIHMNLGILMSLFNNMYFRDTLSTLCEFIPQMIFLNSLFGYLGFLMLLKWISGSTVDLYHVLIYMFLAPGTVDEQGYAFPGQAAIQVLLLLLAVASVPVMLLPKPLILNARHNAHKQAQKRRSGQYVSVADEEEVEVAVEDPSSHGHGSGSHFDFSEVLVHQMIHTIEFVLGAVSNTASYLRLWALSLAHSQLSSVFYERVLMASFRAAPHDPVISAIAMFVGFFVFAIASLGVLMVMESLSAFLHALRLHWVEFQNKFYRGDGYPFVPFKLGQPEISLT